MRKIVVTTGGTGGHIFPALSVIEALRERDSGVEILFVGATYGPEAKLASAAHVPFAGLPGRGMLGRGLRAVPAAFDNLRALAKAVKLLHDFRPCVVAAFGGYASFPAALAACLLRVPLLLHEQNAVAGTVNRLLGRFAAARCVSLPGTRGVMEPCVLTGNPVRSDIGKKREARSSDSRRLLVLGGSQGARSLNRQVVAMLKQLKQAKVEILHQTGPHDLDEIRSAYAQAGYDAQCVQPFIGDMASAYQWADLAFCRAGASTVAELCVAGLPAVLTPFPAAIHDHQTLNARVMEKAAAAVLLPEAELGRACGVLLGLLANHDLLAEMSRAASSAQRPEAAELVAIEIEKLCLSSSSVRADKQ